MRCVQRLVVVWVGVAESCGRIAGDGAGAHARFHHVPHRLSGQHAREKWIR